MKRKRHWERNHTEKDPHELTWYQETPTLSLQMLESAGAAPQSAVIDVGGGASSFVDHLLANGHENVTVLDISNVALDQSRRRLGPAAEKVHWIIADVLRQGGHAIITTFAEDGPEKCSGLPCARYSPKALQAELGADRFRLVGSAPETHLTPRGEEQRFQYSLLQKVPR